MDVYVCKTCINKFLYKLNLFIRILGEGGNIMEIKVTNPKVVGKAIKEITFPEKSLMVMVQRGDESIIAHNSLKLEYNDIATIIAEESSGRLISDILFR